MSASVDIDRVSALIAEIAAEEILPRFTKLAAGDIREKAPGDVVTIADEATEHRLSPRLIEMLAGSTVLGEEGAAKSPELLDRLAGDAPVWVIDPVDGTSNFAQGSGDFGVMVALVRHDQVLAGWIHDPRRQETLTAELGGGAWLNSQRLDVARPPADPAKLSGVLLAGFFGDRKLGEQVQTRRGLLSAMKSLRCAASEYRRLAEGEMHFALFTKLMPWDHCPGVLIHAEAGGYNRYVEGGTYQPSRPRASGLMLAPDAASWQQLYDILIAPEPTTARRR
jgi:fructose-1,6-bisphosphatase/inositol monophosphatase family enzyme